MKQTKKLNPNFKADLIIKYKEENGLRYSDILQLLSGFDESILNVNESTFKQYLNGTINTVPINLLKAMAKLVGVTLDYFCCNNTINDIDTEIQNKLGFTAETANNLIKNKPHRWLFNADKRPKEISKTDYTAVLNLFLDKKIPTNVGKKSAIDVFSTNMLNLFISTVVYDKTILETFKENFINLSSAINVNKTRPLGKPDNENIIKPIINADIDMSFDEIFNSPTIQKVYRNATHEMHDTIDKLLETALKESFDSAKPKVTWF